VCLCLVFGQGPCARDERQRLLATVALREMGLETAAFGWRTNTFRIRGEGIGVGARLVMHARLQHGAQQPVRLGIPLTFPAHVWPPYLKNESAPITCTSEFD